MDIYWGKLANYLFQYYYIVNTSTFGTSTLRFYRFFFYISPSITWNGV